jgi:hypothetical protein
MEKSRAHSGQVQLAPPFSLLTIAECNFLLSGGLQFQRFQEATLRIDHSRLSEGL